MRINKYLAQHGYASRRKADELISSGKVRINGKTAVLGDQVENTDIVEVLGIKHHHKAPLVYYLLNKPVGYICTTDPHAPGNVLELVPKYPRVYPVGRLDVASSGALLLTNDGELANELLHPKFGHKKVYKVETTKPIHDADLKTLETGVDLIDGKTASAEIKRLDINKFKITLSEGRNRQIRRMCEALGYEVKNLHRTQFASYKLDAIRSGEWQKVNRNSN